MMGGVPNRCLFTASQLEEFKHQALIYNYMVSGVPVPTDLLFALKRNLDFSSTLFLHKQGKCYNNNTPFSTEYFSVVPIESLKYDHKAN